MRSCQYIVGERPRSGFEPEFGWAQFDGHDFRLSPSKRRGGFGEGTVSDAGVSAVRDYTTFTEYDGAVGDCWNGSGDLGDPMDFDGDFEAVEPEATTTNRREAPPMSADRAAEHRAHRRRVEPVDSDDDADVLRDDYEEDERGGDRGGDHPPQDAAASGAAPPAAAPPMDQEERAPRGSRRSPAGTEWTLGPYKDDNALKGGFQPHEDDRLVQTRERMGGAPWTVISSYVPGRSGVDCSRRWNSTLDPSIDWSPWRADEWRTLISAKARGDGNIAGMLPGRPAGMVGNCWATNIVRIVTFLEEEQAAGAVVGAGESLLSLLRDEGRLERAVELVMAPRFPGVSLVPRWNDEWRAAFKEQMEVRANEFEADQRIRAEAGPPPRQRVRGRPYTEAELSVADSVASALGQKQLERVRRTDAPTATAPRDGEGPNATGDAPTPANTAAPMEVDDDSNPNPGGDANAGGEDAGGRPTTEAPTTEAPTTEAPTTEASTTEASTTEAPPEEELGSIVAKFLEICCESRADGEPELLSDGSQPRSLSGLTILLTGAFESLAEFIDFDYRGHKIVSKVLRSQGAKVVFESRAERWDVLLVGDVAAPEKLEKTRARRAMVWTVLDVARCMRAFPRDPSASAGDGVSDQYRRAMSCDVCFTDEGAPVCPNLKCTDPNCRMAHRCMGDHGGHPRGTIMPSRWFECDLYSARSSLRRRLIDCFACSAYWRARAPKRNARARAATVERNKRWDAVLGDDGEKSKLTDDDIEELHAELKEEIKALIRAFHRARGRDDSMWVLFHGFGTSLGSRTMEYEGTHSSITTYSAGMYVAREDQHLERLLTTDEAKAVGDPPVSLRSQIESRADARIVERLVHQIGRELVEEGWRIRLLYRRLGAGGAAGLGHYDVAARLFALDDDGVGLVDGPANARLHPGCLP